MNFVSRLRAAAAALAVAALTGCAHLPFFSNKTADSAESKEAIAAATPIERADYRLDVDAPDPLKKLLETYLDLARFQNAPATEGINAAELERLMRAAPAQARGLLETEGYFNGEVTVERDDSGGALPLLRVRVVPGARAIVSDVTIEINGALQTAAAAGDAGAVRELAFIRNLWPLGKGVVFRQGSWVDAKNTTVARLRADGYAAAGWSSTSAKVDAPSNSVRIATVLDSGPLYRLGTMRIEGLSRYDEDSVRRLATFGAGDPYSDKALLDFQERLQKVGLFEGASVELEPDPANPAESVVLVHVKEQPLQQATFGVGYSANTGPRLSVEHIERRVFGSRWIAKNKFELGPEQKTWQGDLTSHPLDGLYRNLVSGSATSLRNDDQTLLGWNARIGRTQDTTRIERLYFGEFTHARVEGGVLTSDADALSANYHWIYRAVDNVLLPTQGLTTSAQAAVGASRGSRSILGGEPETARGPFARAYARLTWYEPLGSSWFASARVEAGEVFTRNVVGVPDTLLFRAGGDDSVRGYGYRSLGPDILGTTVGGRTLLTGSLEIAHPISANYPAYWWAAFVDAGNAADRWSQIDPAIGYGVGLRWRSPVGPLRVDVAYGERVREVRLHLSVGIAF